MQPVRYPSDPGKPVAKGTDAGPGTIFSPGQGIRGARNASGHDKLADELEWLKKNSSLSIEVKLSLIDGCDPEL
jgi:hypothetical protein